MSILLSYFVWLAALDTPYKYLFVGDELERDDSTAY